MAFENPRQVLLSMICSNMCVFFPDMADLCPSSKPDGPVPEGQPGGGQLVLAGLHGGRHPSHHRGHVDDRHSRSASHGTTTLTSGSWVVFTRIPCSYPPTLFSLRCSWFWVPGWACLVQWCASVERWPEKRPHSATLCSCWVRPSVLWVNPSSFLPPPSLQLSGSLITNVQRLTWSPPCVSFLHFINDLNPKNKWPVSADARAVIPLSASRGLC